MRFHQLLATYLFLSVSLLSPILAAELPICPMPKFLDFSLTDYVPLSKITIVCHEKGTSEWAETHLKEWYGNFAPKVESVLPTESLTGEEAYTLLLNEDGVVVNAQTLKGVRYALYTLRQIAIPTRGTQTVLGWIVPKGEIKDEPSMAFRGIHVCWFHETQPWEIERQIRLAAYYKLNYMVIEPWGTFRSEVAPWYGWPDGTMTKEEIRRLKSIADDLGITLIPQINVFGHASSARVATGKHAVLDLNPEYQPLFEPLGGWNWCLSNPETTKLLTALICEMHETFGNPPYFHIGCDEASQPSCPECVKESYSELFVNHIKAMAEVVASLGAKTMMWHDMLLDGKDTKWTGFIHSGTAETAQAVLNLPKDIVICDWYYGDGKECYPTLDYFKELGFPVLTCPWDNRQGIISQSRYAQKTGLYGVLGTTWHHNFGNALLECYLILVILYGTHLLLCL